MEAPEQERCDQDDDDQDELQQPIEPERPADSVRDPTADHAADRDATEVAGQDRGDRLGRVAEHEDELTRPDHLVHEPGGPGQEEYRQDRPPPAINRARRGGLEAFEARPRQLDQHWTDRQDH